MKLSLDWIKDYVKLPNNLDISRLAYDLTMSTVEVESVTELARNFNNMVIGTVKEILPHPNADFLKICKTDVGEKDLLEIVCGGVNLKEGMKVVVARSGAIVRWHGEGDPVEIEDKKVRGVESYGMICASSEIGLFDLFPFNVDATIMDMSEFDTQAGTPLVDALGLNDVIFEIDNKSLTNRPDLWGHYGIAREISALYNLPLYEFQHFTSSSPSTFLATIEDLVKCPRYVGVKIKNLEDKSSEFKIRSRIWRVGMRPTNAIVDITNYVMLATGQPIHAFDADSIKGCISVRHAYEGEKLLLLNHKELILSTDDLVIADDKEAIALAGIMGGAKNSVFPKTNHVILEIANFNAISIRRTSAKYGIRTEAVARYEKAIDPERIDIAISLAIQLFIEHFQDMLITGFFDNYPNRLKKSEINVPLDWLEKRLGKIITNNVIADKLEHLGFKINFDGNIMRIIAPTWRSTGDISIPEDIIEEIARMYGYENFDPTPITTTFVRAINQLKIDIDRKIKEFLAFRCGMREIFTYPWMHDKYVNAVFPNKTDLLLLSAPPSPDECYIRSSLLPNLCKAIKGNLRFFNEFAIFELAQVFFNRDFGTPYDPHELLPSQQKNIAGSFVGNSRTVDILFRKAKGVIEALSSHVHIEPLMFARNEKPFWADDVIWLNIIHGDKQVGNLALLSKKASLDCDIKNSAVIIFELNIDLLKPYPSRTNCFSHLPEYPMTNYDISLVFDLSIKWDEILKTATEDNDSNSILQRISFVDDYKGNQVPEGKKSVTCRLVIGSLMKTLSSDEIENCVANVVKRLTEKLRAELRS